MARVEGRLNVKLAERKYLANGVFLKWIWNNTCQTTSTASSASLNKTVSHPSPCFFALHSLDPHIFGVLFAPTPLSAEEHRQGMTLHLKNPFTRSNQCRPHRLSCDHSCSRQKHKDGERNFFIRRMATGKLPSPLHPLRLSLTPPPAFVDYWQILWSSGDRLSSSGNS